METGRHGPGDRSRGERTPSEQSAAGSAAEWLVDAIGCDRGPLSNLECVRRICGEVIEGLQLHVIGEPRWHQFPSRDGSGEPGGVTGLYLLAESHLACHTFPEDGLASFNLYCCRGGPAWHWKAFLRERLGADQVVVRSARRGRLAFAGASEPGLERVGDAPPAERFVSHPGGLEPSAPTRKLSP